MPTPVESPENLKQTSVSKADKKITKSQSNQPRLTKVFCSANVESSSKLSDDKFTYDYNITRTHTAECKADWACVCKEVKGK